MNRENYLKLADKLDRLQKIVNAQRAIVDGFVPQSIKKEMDILGINKLDDIPTSTAIKAAESGYDPNKGIIRGLDVFEIEAIRKINLKRAHEYDKMEISETNQKNLKLDREFFLKDKLHLATEYNTAVKKQGNKFTRFFMSAEQIKERDEAARIAKMRLDAAWREYELLKKNKISYRTIQQWQEGQLP